MTDLGPAGASRFARGALFLIAAQGIRLGSQLVGLVLLSRLLGPTAFGVAAIAMLVVGVGEMLRDAGLGSAMVRARHIGRPQRDALFWISTSMGAAMCVLIVLLSGPLAALFNTPELAPALRILSAVFVINAMATPYRAMHNRGSRFRTIAAADASAALVGLAVAVVAASLGAGFWALILQSLTAAVVMMGILVTAGQWLPGAYHRGTGVLRVVRFGISVLVSQALSYVGDRMDMIILGLRYPTSVVGAYSRAFQISVTTIEQVKAPTVAVALSALTQRAGDEHRWLEFVRLSQVMVTVATFPLLAILSALASQVVRVVLGPGWEGAIAPVAILAAGAAIQQAASTAGVMLISAGDGRALQICALLSASIRVGLVLAFSSHGAVGVSLGYTLGAVLAYPMVMAIAGRAIGVSVAPLLGQAIRLLAVSTVIAVVTWSVLRALHIEVLVLSLAIAGIVTIATGAAAAVSFRSFRMDLAEFYRTAMLVLRRS